MNEQQIAEWLLKNGFKGAFYEDEECIADENEIYRIYFPSATYWQIWGNSGNFDWKYPKNEEELKAIIGNLIGIKHL